jgi:hypothetical protein
MAILYDECLELYHKGVRTWDAHKQEFFQLRMLVFDVICDFPGPLIIKLSAMSSSETRHS